MSTVTDGLSAAWRLAWFLLVTEWRMYVGAARLLARRPDVPAGSVAVPYVAPVAALLWAFTVVSAVELVALHFIIPWEGVRLVADVLGVWGVVWCFGLTGCHYVYPHLAGPDDLRLRLQRHAAAVTVPWDVVASVRVRDRNLESGKAVQVDGRTASVPVDKRTNLELVLSRPVAVVVRGVTHEVDEVRVHVDDPRETARLARAFMGSGALERS